MSSLPLDALGAGSAFAGDPRFSVGRPVSPPPPVEDPVAVAWAEGHAAGIAEALADAEARRVADEESRTRIELALGRLCAEQEELLRQRLIETVRALCEGAIAPLALDAGVLADRVARAAAMLARADDAAVLRLHPDDLALIGNRLPPDLPVEPDAALERGALRLDGRNGGVDDGPALWRRAIAEALG
jgi:flagellar assembly protein FliH